MMTLQHLLKAVVKQRASDLHVVVGTAPLLRIDGQLVKVKAEPLNDTQTRQLCYSILTDQQKARFESTKELDFSFEIKGLARFRANLFFQKGSVSGAFRRIPLDIPDLDALQMPSVISETIHHPSGLILVTGPTGSGKTTTIAALVDKINRERRQHIITLEDPIEFLHEHKSCIVNQREVGLDTSSYKQALKYVLRQDPDVCVLGEMRDLETIEAALNVAETGHLVLATLHTNSAVQTMNRIVNVFPAEQQDRIRIQLSFVLQAIISQRLVPAIPSGRVAALEVLLLNPNIRNLIRENKLHQIYGMMQVGQDKSGMITLNQSLVRLVMKRRIEIRRAFEFSNEPDELDKMLKQAGV